MSFGRQLALPFPHRPEFATADFLEAPSNAAALAWLGRVAEWPAGKLALWGEEGCGKTHLLHHWSAREGAKYLPGVELRDLPPIGALAIDDADACADEAILLHAMNAAGEAGRPVLLAGRLPPARWRVRLPDLASRLRASVAVKIDPPEDGLLRALLARLLAERHLPVAEGLQEWLLLRMPRTPAAIRELAARLDRAAFALGRAVTRQMAASVLAEMAERD